MPWVCAQGLATLYDSILRKSIDAPWPSDIFFFCWMTPAFLSLFLDSTAPQSKRNWQQWLDFAQVFLLIASAYVFTFEVSEHWLWPGGFLQKIGFTIEWVRDTLVVALETWN